MAKAVDGLAKLRERASRARADGHREYNPGWHTALDLKNLLAVAEAVVRSALDRRESRGAHFREDYPSKDEAHGYHNTVTSRGGDGHMSVVRLDIPEIREDLRQIIEEMG